MGSLVAMACSVRNRSVLRGEPASPPCTHPERDGEARPASLYRSGSVALNFDAQLTCPSQPVQILSPIVLGAPLGETIELPSHRTGRVPRATPSGQRAERRPGPGYPPGT